MPLQICISLLSIISIFHSCLTIDLFSFSVPFSTELYDINVRCRKVPPYNFQIFVFYHPHWWIYVLTLYLFLFHFFYHFSSEGLTHNFLDWESKSFLKELGWIEIQQVNLFLQILVSNFLSSKSVRFGKIHLHFIFCSTLSLTINMT